MVVWALCPSGGGAGCGAPSAASARGGGGSSKLAGHWQVDAAV